MLLPQMAWTGVFGASAAAGVDGGTSNRVGDSGGGWAAAAASPGNVCLGGGPGRCSTGGFGIGACGVGGCSVCIGDAESACCAASLPVGMLLKGGRYCVARQLQSGSTAVVYAAFDAACGRSVALKCLRHRSGDAALVRKGGGEEERWRAWVGEFRWKRSGLRGVVWRTWVGEFAWKGAGLRGFVWRGERHTQGEGCEKCKGCGRWGRGSSGPGSNCWQMHRRCEGGGIRSTWGMRSGGWAGGRV
eukprot:363738-Chlamydomonas_euryale.AAC.3